MITTKDTQIQIRAKKETKQALEEKSKFYGFTSLSEYLVFVGLNAVVKVKATKEEK